MASFIPCILALSLTLASVICIADAEDIKFAEDLLEDTHGQIIFSSVLFRHGARTPKGRYSNDPYPATIWIEGLGQLTKAGKQQVYDLGKWFRQRYTKLVPVTGYRYDILQMNSSDTDRTIMSAELFLAGMFPPSENETWASDGLRWQPIPVHTKPMEMDNAIRILDVPCPRETLEKSSVKNSAAFRKFKEKYEDVILYTAEHAGYNGHTDDFDHKLNYFESVFDVISVEASFNLTLPTWTNKIYPEPATTIISEYYTDVSFNAEILRLTGGPLLSSIVSEMQQKRDNSTKKLFHFYSGHDTTVTIILNTLSVYNLITPPLAASLIFELREKDSDYNVVILYRNTTEAPPYVLQIPGCKNICTLDNFIEVTKALIPENWNEECQLGFFENLLGDFGIADMIEFVLIVGFFAVLLMAIFALCIVKRRRYSSYQMI